MPAQTASAEQLSVLFDVTVRHINRLADQSVIKRYVDPVTKKQVHPAQYELIPNVRSYVAYLREAARLDDAGESLYRQLRNQKISAEAERAQLELKAYKKKIHRQDDVEFVLTTMLTSVKSRLLAIPSRVTRSVMGKTDFQEIYAIIYAEIELALRELADYDPNAFARANEDYLNAVGARAPNGKNGDHAEDADTGNPVANGA